MKINLLVTKPNGAELHRLSGVEYDDLSEALRDAKRITFARLKREFEIEEGKHTPWGGECFTINLYLMEDECGQVWEFNPDPGDDEPPCLYIRDLNV